jgi:hypothetical protein
MVGTIRPVPSHYLDAAGKPGRMHSMEEIMKNLWPLQASDFISALSDSATSKREFSNLLIKLSLRASVCVIDNILEEEFS